MSQSARHVFIIHALPRKIGFFCHRFHKARQVQKKNPLCDYANRMEMISALLWLQNNNRTGKIKIRIDLSKRLQTNHFPPPLGQSIAFFLDWWNDWRIIRGTCQLCTCYPTNGWTVREKLMNDETQLNLKPRRHLSINSFQSVTF